MHTIRRLTSLGHYWLGFCVVCCYIAFSPTLLHLPQLCVFWERGETTPGQLFTQKFEEGGE